MWITLWISSGRHFLYKGESVYETPFPVYEDSVLTGSP